MKRIALVSLICLVLRLQGQSNFTEISQEILRVTHEIEDPETLDSLVNLAYHNSGLLFAFDEEIEMHEEEIVQKRRNWISSFRLGINIFSTQTYASPGNESITQVGVLPNMGLSLVIDPEKIVNRGSYIRQAAHKRERSRGLQRDHRQRIKKEVLNHYYEYLTMLERLVIKEKTYNTRKQHMSLMEVEFKNGSITYDQLLVVQNQYHLWEEELVKARIQAEQKKREIDVFLGH